MMLVSQGKLHDRPYYWVASRDDFIYHLSLNQFTLPKPMRENSTRVTNKIGMIVSFLVFLSGFCSLTYQVIWERTLKYSFGGDVISASIIVSVFLLGLGIGGFLFRKIKKRALISLALVELFIGLFGLWSYEIILYINDFLITLNLKLGLGHNGEALSVFAGTFIFLLLPTILMGGTLPLMFESFIPKIDKNTKFIGLVYGINTLGAFAGALLPTLVFGTLGLPNTLKITSLVSVFISIVLFVMVLRRKKPETMSKYPKEIKEAFIWNAQNVFIVGFAFMSGFIALALEILFIRFIGIMHGSTSYSFPIIISSYLFSMSIGSVFWSFIRDRLKNAKILPFILQACVGTLVPLTLFFFQFVLSSKANPSFDFMKMFTAVTDLFEKGKFLAPVPTILQFSLPLFILIFPIVFFSSGVFPTLIKNFSEQKISIGKSTGIIYFSNSVGCTLGSLATGFVVIPMVGWHPALVAVSLLSFFVGAAGFYFLKLPLIDMSKSTILAKYKYLFALLCLVVIPVVVFSVSDRKIKYKLATGQYSPKISIVSYQEGSTGVAAVTEEKRGRGVILNVYSNGQYMSALPNHPRHAYLANLPRMQKKLSSVLFLGLGGGRSLSDLLSDKRVKNIVAVDWSREIVKVVGSDPIIKFNRNPLADPRVRIEMSDARKVVSSFAQRSVKFDAVIDNLCFPHWPGAGGVKSIQFFESIKKILGADGYYYHINNFNQERNLILYTLSKVFPHVSVHNGMMVICGDTPYSPSESQVKEILGEKNLLARAPDLFIPNTIQPDEYYPFFKKTIAKIRQKQLGQLHALTDEIPSTEYFISITFLIDKIKAGLK
jgi:predicted membrane-bound spermidine synthase